MDDTPAAEQDTARDRPAPRPGPGGVRVGVIGASGYTGTELLRLCASHPEFEVVAVTGDSMAGTRVADLYPNLAAAYGDLRYETYDRDDFTGLDLVFLGLPHGTSQPIVAELLGRVGVVADMGADFRLGDPSLYPIWYGAEHTHPELLPEFVYGLPEYHREALRGARGIAVPGCYPTATILALAPLVEGGVVRSSGLIVDAASGVSGAGRGPRANTQFCAVDENLAAYGLDGHRHTPEMDQALGGQVLFTPHLAPMNRGILATCHGQPTPAGEGLGTAEVLDVLRSRYLGEPFVVVTDGSPSTKAVMGSNVAQVGARVDPRTGLVTAFCAIDNLCKGSAGGAVQSANIALGLDERTGLPTVGLLP